MEKVKLESKKFVKFFYNFSSKKAYTQFEKEKIAKTKRECIEAIKKISLLKHHFSIAERTRLGDLADLHDTNMYLMQKIQEQKNYMTTEEEVRYNEQIYKE